MAPPKRKGKQPDPYDTVFDVLFGSYKAPKQKIIPGRGITMPGMGGFAQNLAEMALAPGLYAIEDMMADMEAEANAFAEVEVEPLKGFKVKVGTGNLLRFIANPRGAIDKAYSKYEAGKKWGKRGAGYRAFDSALLSLAAKRAGLSGREAMRMGSMVRGQRGKAGIHDARDSHMWRYDAERRIENNIKDAVKERHGIDRDEMDEIIKGARQAGDRSKWSSNARLTHMMRELRSRGVSGSDAKKIAQQLWGKTQADEVVMRDRLVRNWGIARSDASSMARDIWAKREEYAGEDGSEKMQAYLRSKGMSNSDAKDAVDNFRKSWESQGMWSMGKNDDYVREMDYTSTMDVIQSKIEGLDKIIGDPRASVQAKSEAQRQKDKLTAYQGKVARYYNFLQTGKGHGGIYGLGMRIGRAQHVRAAMAEAPANIRAVLFTGDAVAIQNLFSIRQGGKYGWGTVFDFKKGDLRYGRGSQLKEVCLTRQGDAVRHRAAEWLYYYHPVNFAKGLIWDGRTWGKLAMIAEKRGWIGARDTFMNVGSWTPRQLLLRRKKLPSVRKLANEKTRELMGKMFSKLLGKSAKDLALLPIKEIIKQVVMKVVAQLLGNAIAPVIGGIIVAVGGFLIEKLAKPLMGCAVLLVFGIVALISFAGMSLFGGIKPTMRFSRHLSDPITAVGSPYGLEIVDPDEWAQDSLPPNGYSGVCMITSGSVGCGQGPCGGFSHQRLGTRAVDLSWNNMASNPGIVAPSDGEVIYSRASSTCGDGTEYGGLVIFRDSNGYEWLFIHVRPVATGSVSAGQVIGEVQFAPEVQVGACWTGAHLHLSIKNADGQVVDAQEFLNNAGCSFTCPPSQDC